MQQAINLAALPAGAHLTVADICGTADRRGVLPICKSSFYARVKQGIFPQPTRIGSRRSVWTVEVVRQLVADMYAGKFA
jgi:hypothetical protein